MGLFFENQTKGSWAARTGFFFFFFFLLYLPVKLEIQQSNGSAN